MGKQNKLLDSNNSPHSDSNQQINKSSPIQIATESYFKGPLPPPEILEGYKNIYPKAPEIIFSVFESQVKHRHGLENKWLDNNFRNEKRGMWLGFSIALAIIIPSFILIFYGHDIVGGIFGGSTIVSLVSLFIYGANRGKKDIKKLQDHENPQSQSPYHIPFQINPKRKFPNAFVDPPPNSAFFQHGLLLHPYNRILIEHTWRLQ